MGPINFRPHHLLCTLGFRGHGYSEAFVANYKDIVAQLQEGRPLTVVAGIDDICAACPCLTEDRSACQGEENIRRLDALVAKTLQVRVGEILTWTEVKQRIRQHVTVEKLRHICHGCRWRELGHCEAAVRQNAAEMF